LSSIGRATLLGGIAIRPRGARSRLRSHRRLLACLIERNRGNAKAHRGEETGSKVKTIFHFGR
jgi:hypothetical protein